MATTTTRVKDIPTTATTAASDDYFVIDGATNGTRKYNHNADAAAHVYSELVGALRTGLPLSCIGLGDSIIAGNSTEKHKQQPSSWFEQLCIASGGRLKPIRNSGVPGETAAQIAARVQSDVIAYSPRVCILQCGANNAVSGEYNASTPEMVASSALTAIRALRAAGVIPVLASMTPINQSVSDRPVAINAALEAMATANGVTWLDVFSPVADGSSLGASYTSDGLHLNELGAVTIATARKSDFENLPAIRQTHLPSVATDAQSLLANPLFADVDMDGVPDSWSNLMPAAGVVFSTASAPIGNSFTVTKSGENAAFAISSLQEVTVGWRLALACKLKTVFTTTDFNPLIYIQFTGGSNNLLPLFQSARDSEGVLWFEGDVPSGTTAAALVIYIASGRGSVTLERAAVYRTA